MRLLRAAVVVGFVAVVATGCGTSQETEEEPAGRQGSDKSWRRLPDAPLSPRDHAVIVGVGDRMLVVGGWEFLCPPNADCSFPEGSLLDNGAVYDATTDSWETISPPPFGLRRTEYATASIDDTAYLLTGCADDPSCDAPQRLLSYSVAQDGWTDHGELPGPKHHRQLVAVGSELVAYSGSEEYGEAADLLFDPERARWTAVPDDPLPRSYDRFIVPVGDQLVVVGSSLAAVDSGDDDMKQVARFDLGNGRWTRLPDAPGRGYQLLATDRGPLLNGHFIDSPGWLLDPDTWTWSELPGQSGEQTDLSGVLNRDGAVYDIPNSVGRMAATTRLYLYDSTAGSLVAIPPPPTREDVYDDSSAALGRDLFIYGGQRWTGDGLDGDGELVGDAWLWSAPEE